MIGETGGAGSGRPGGAGSAGAGLAGAGDSGGGAQNYDDVILADGPVLYLAMSGTTTEPDLSGHGHEGSYEGDAPTRSILPNGDAAAAFDGVQRFLTVPSDPAFSIPTTGELTWEAWINPAVLQFPNDSGGYVDWMGKCAEYSPTCEWEARLYNTTNSQDRCNRFSAYAFNPSAGLGSGADFQPECGLIEAGAWYHVVGLYTLESAPSSCANTDAYPGSIDIWVNGVNWKQSRHGQTGCMSQYDVTPVANDSPIHVGTMAEDSWFQGAVGKLAIYDRLLTSSEIVEHYTAMTGAPPTGTCDDTCTF